MSRDEIFLLMKNFCDQIDSHMPEDRKDHQMIMTRMHNIGLLTEDECIDYIYNKFGEKDITDENRSDL